MGDTITIKKENLWRYSTFILAAIVIVGAFVIFSQDRGAPTGNVVANPNAPLPGQNEPVEVSADDDAFLGPENAEIVVIEFSDFECPYCGAAMGTHEVLVDRFKSQDPTWEAAVPELKRLAEEGKIKFVYRDFPLSGHPNAQKAAEASECAKDQGKFWEYHDILFANQDALTVPSLKQYASQIGLNTNEFNECLDSNEKAAEVQKDMQDGQNAGVSGTPSFFVNGREISGSQPYKVFEQAINAASA